MDNKSNQRRNKVNSKIKKKEHLSFLREQLNDLRYRFDHCNTSDAEDILFQMITYLSTMIEEVIRDMDSK